MEVLFIMFIVLIEIFENAIYQTARSLCPGTNEIMEQQNVIHAGDPMLGFCLHLMTGVTKKQNTFIKIKLCRIHLWAFGLLIELFVTAKIDVCIKSEEETQEKIW